MGRLKQQAVIWMSGALLMLTCGTAMASTRTEIDSISLDVESNIEAGDSSGDVDVTCDSGDYYVDDIEITNEPKNGWDDGDKPKLKVTVEAEDDYYFSSGLSKSDVDLRGADGKVTSVTRKSSTLIVYITLDSLDGSDSGYDLDVYGLEWDESDGMASWEDSGDARKYEVRLYRNDNSVTSVLTTSDTSYDFSGYITKSGDYLFKVRAVYSSSDKGSWEESDSWYVSSEEADEISDGRRTYGSSSSSYKGAWLRDSVGWWYCNADKSYTVNNWQYIDDRWYFFNAAGYMVTGWIDWGGRWYYCGDDGAMYYNTTTPDGYYVGMTGPGCSELSDKKRCYCVLQHKRIPEERQLFGDSFSFKEVYPRLSVDHYFLHGIC